MESQINDRIEDTLSDHDWLEEAAGALQPRLREALDALPSGVVNFLHGAPLGHPLHPILIHLPLGGWIVAGLLDFLPGGSQETQQAADRALLLGTVGAVGAIAAGWTDWSNSRGEARRTGLLHGSLNEAAFTLNLASLWARKRGKRRLGKALSGSALALAGVGGFLGGQLVYRHGLGVGHTMTVPQG